MSERASVSDGESFWPSQPSAAALYFQNLGLQTPCRKVSLTMKRRSLLSWFGASAAGALTPVSALPNPPGRTRILALESFQISDPQQMPRVHDYLSGALLPVLRQIHDGPKMFLDAIVAPHTPQTLLLAAFSSFDEMLAINTRIAAHPGIRQARAHLELVNSPINQIQSQVLMVIHESLRGPARPDHLESGVFELRSYYAPGWQNGPPEAFGMVLSRAGIHPAVCASTAASEHTPRFTYLIPFESLAARNEAWAKLEAGKEWIALQRESAGSHGSAAKVSGASIYKLTPYSPA